MTSREMLLVAAAAAAAAASLLASCAAICALLPRVRLRQAAAVNLSSTAAANALPAGGAVAVGISWAMLSRWGIGAQEFVRYTLVSGLWNVFVRLGLPVIALLVLAISGQPGEIPHAVAYCSGGADRSADRRPRRRGGSPCGRGGAAVPCGHLPPPCATGRPRLPVVAARPPEAGGAERCHVGRLMP
jgi:hypothetical protein